MKSVERERGWILSKLSGKTIQIDIISVLLFAVFLGAVGLDIFLGFGSLRALLAFGVFMTLPGALLLTLLGYGPRPTLTWLLYITGTNLLMIMVVGFLLNLTLPLLGIERPISPHPLGATYGVIVLGLAAAVRFMNPKGRTLTTPDYDALRSWLDRWFRPTTFALLLFPPLTILSVAWLNRTSDNRPILVILLLVALLPVVIAAGKIAKRWLPLAVWVTGISLLYHDTLYVLSRFSGQGNIIEAWQTGNWAMTQRGADAAATTPLLPNVTISPTFAHLGNIDIFTQLDVFNPLFVALIPLGSFVIFRRFVEEEFAALAAIVVTFIHPFYFQLPTGGRAATPVLFLVLTAVALTDSEFDPVLRQGLALGFAAALVTSHYGASYFAMVGFGAAVVFLFGLRVVDEFVFESARQRLASDGGNRLSNIRSILRTRRSSLSVSFVAFYLAMVFGWYLYTFEGQKLSAFFGRVNRALTSFLSDGAGGGGTANRLTREYGMASVQLSRRLYVLLAVLSAIGVAYLLVKRLTSEEWRNRDGFDVYLVLGAGILGTFSLTFLFQAIWGGGRPMAITFAVTALFAVVGMYAVAVAGAKAFEHISGNRLLSDASVRRTAGVAFAVVLVALLLLNSGFMAATVLGGGAPSEVPLHEDRENYFEQDVSAYVWINNHGDTSLELFSDLNTRTSANDWYKPQVVAREDPETAVSHRWNQNLPEVMEYEGSSYVVLSSHNVIRNVAVLPEGSTHTGARGGEDMSEINEELSDSSRIYTTGASEIYFNSS